MAEQEEEAISTAPEAVMEYTAQLLTIMQEKAESRGGVAVLGELPMPLLRVLAVSAYGSSKRHTLTLPVALLVH